MGQGDGVVPTNLLAIQIDIKTFDKANWRHVSIRVQMNALADL